MENSTGIDYEYRGCSIHVEYSSYEDALIFSVALAGATEDDADANAYGEAVSVDEYLELVDDIIDQLEYYQSRKNLPDERDHEDVILSDLDMEKLDQADLEGLHERITEQIREYESANTDYMLFRGYRIKVVYDPVNEQIVGTIDGIPNGIIRARSLQRIWHHSQLMIDEYLQEASKHVLNSLM